MSNDEAQRVVDSGTADVEQQHGIAARAPYDTHVDDTSLRSDPGGTATMTRLNRKRRKIVHESDSAHESD